VFKKPRGEGKKIGVEKMLQEAWLKTSIPGERHAFTDF
jgi:hypothetical protein